MATVYIQSYKDTEGKAREGEPLCHPQRRHSDEVSRLVGARKPILDMTKLHSVRLAFKRTFQVGWFSTILSDKCDESWLERECPNPATRGEYHRGQFGHKIVFLFCDKCWERNQEQRANSEFWRSVGSDRKPYHL